MKDKKKVLFIPLLFLILFFLYWRFVNYVPLGWKKYTNIETKHNYSFSYPKEWIVSECGNGEVVVAKTSITQCYRPLEALDEYLDSVYFQVFLFENHYGAASKEITVPDQLAGWYTLFFYSNDRGGYIKMRGTIIPVEPVDTEAYVKYSEENRRNKYVTGTENRILVTYLNNFTVGFYPHPEVKDQLGWIQNSFRFRVR